MVFGEFGTNMNSSFSYSRKVTPGTRTQAPLTVFRNLMTGSVSVPTDFMGLHFKNWPISRTGAGGITPAPTCNYGIARSHDSTFNNTGQIFWRGIHTASSTYDWLGSSMDLWVDTHYNSGKSLYYTIYGTPTWAAKAGMTGILDSYNYAGGAAPPQTMSDLGNFVTQLVTRYNVPTRKIKYLEIWNEPNYAGNTSGGQASGFFMGTASEMAQMAKTVYQAAKAVDGGITVISPAHTSTTWLSQFAAATDGGAGTGKDWSDGLGHHFYNTFPLYDNQNLSITKVLADLRTQMTTSGYSGSYPIYNSEQGFITTGGDPWLNDTSRNKYISLTRNLMYQAAYGVKVAILYGHDDTVTMGSTPMYSEAHLQTVVNTIGNNVSGKTITQLDVMSNGQFRMKFSGTTPDLIV